MANSKKDLTIEQICELMPKVVRSIHLSQTHSNDSIIPLHEIVNHSTKMSAILTNGVSRNCFTRNYMLILMGQLVIPLFES